MPRDPNQIPLSDRDLERWKARIRRSRDLRKKRLDSWKLAVQHYNGEALVDTNDRDEIVINKEFPFLEMKRSRLIFQVPEVTLEPLMPGLEDQTRLFQRVINHELGRAGADAKIMIDETLFDALAMGMGPSKIGYDLSMGQRRVMQPVIDPATEQPVVDPLTGQPQLQEGTEPYIQKERFFWDRVSTTRYLLPAEFEGSNYDDASWQAWEFDLDPEDAVRRYKLPKDFEHDSARQYEEGDDLAGEKSDIGHERESQQAARFIEIWYYASRFDHKETHPDRMRVLVICDGYGSAVDHRNSPYQRMDDRGELHGLRGHCLHPLTLRPPASNSIYPRSDIELSVHLSDELSKGRTQMVFQRDTNTPIIGYDRTRVTQKQVQEMQQPDWNRFIGFDGPPHDLVTQMGNTQFPRENFSFNEVIADDHEELWALPRAQRGLTEDAARTATEIQTVNSSAQVRLDSEQTRALEWWAKGAEKFGALLQLFKTDQGYVKVLGPDRVETLQAWDRTQIQGRFLFTAKPDSARRIDAGVRRKQQLDLYNLTGKDPNVRRVELLKQIFRSYDLDPSTIVVDQLPEPKPEPPRITLSFRGEDLLNPHVVSILKASGVPIPDEAAAVAQQAQQIRQAAGTAPHGGPAEQANPIAQHPLRGTGGAPSGQAQRPTGPRPIRREGQP